MAQRSARMFEAARTAAASSGGVRATAPAIRRAADLGVDLASLKVQGLVTAKTVEAAAGELARPPAPELPMSLAAPSGVERTVLIGAGLGATQVIDTLAADESKMAVAIVDDDQGRWADQVAGVPVVGGTDELKEHKAENRFDTVVIAISTSVLLERGSASCAESPVSCLRTRSTRAPGSPPRWSSALGTSCAPSATSESVRASGISTFCPRTTPSITTTSLGRTSRQDQAA